MLVFRDWDRGSVCLRSFWVILKDYFLRINKIILKIKIKGEIIFWNFYFVNKEEVFRVKSELFFWINNVVYFKEFLSFLCVVIF